MSESQKKDVLYVQMFRNFGLTWNGNQIGGRSSESQFAYLMEAMIHNGSKGISRNTLEEILFAGKDVDNIHHSAQSVLYNARKRLKSAGLPDVNYFVLNNGNYYWTDEVEVVEDAVEFEKAYHQAELSEDPDEKLELYLNAVHLYSGEFLENQVAVVWVARESRKYRTIFYDCVEKAAALLKEKKDYFRMEELGRYAAKIYPLCNWENITMEALVSLGRYEEARTFYENTVDYYLEEQGIRPSSHMMEMLNRLSSSFEHKYDVLDDIQNKLEDGQTFGPGGYVCQYPIFQGIYQIIERMVERGGISVYLMLCTIIDSKGNPMREGPMLDELSERLGEAIRMSTRRSDVINKYGKGQYLILLGNTTIENCKVVQKRINKQFIIGRQRTNVRYHVNSVLFSPDRQTVITETTLKKQEKAG